MEFRSLVRPAARLFSPRVALPTVPCRGHKTTSRTKRSLKIAPHESFLPHSDPRRVALTRLRHTPGSPLEPIAPGKLAPKMDYLRRNPVYNLKAEDIREMKRLRAEDPVTWSVNKLAEKFGCSPVFVKMAAPAPKSHLEGLKRKQERRESRWGAIRTAAREDRKRRTEMLYRGEL